MTNLGLAKSAVTLKVASQADETILQNLAQLYTHDFSDFWAGTAKGELLPDGRFAPYPLEGYWTNPAWSAFLIREGETLLGFALVNDVARTSEPFGRNMAEYFILRKHRGRGVGQAAARELFAQYPGAWQVAVARMNVKARAFWRKAIHSATKATHIRELDVDDERWNGHVLYFDWAE